MKSSDLRRLARNVRQEFKGLEGLAESSPWQQFEARIEAGMSSHEQERQSKSEKKEKENE